MRLLTAFTIAFLFLGPAAAAAYPAALPSTAESINYADKYYRTELYFGRSIPGGGAVTEDEWERFLAEVVTPRFPDGFTILNATGQYREKTGIIDKEKTEVLLFFYPVNKRSISRRKINEIRRAYVTRFRQESVLRLDYPAAVNVDF